MKQLTFNGKGTLTVPGQFTVKSGESHKIADAAAAELLQANPGLPVTITDLPVKSGPKRRPKGGRRRASPSSATSQPEAHEGEGQPTVSTEEKE